MRATNFIWFRKVLGGILQTEILKGTQKDPENKITQYSSEMKMGATQEIIVNTQEVFDCARNV